MYVAPAFSAARVGVRLPLVTPPFADVRPASAVWMAIALLAAIGTATPAPTPQVASVSAKNLRPQLTVVSVCATTILIAGIICAHLEVAPQPLLQFWSLMSLFMEPEASWMMRMSGGSLFSGCMTSRQFIPVTLPWPLWAAPPPTRPVPEALPVPSGPPDAPAPPFPAGAKPQPTSGNKTIVTARAVDRGMVRPPESFVGALA